MKSKTLFYLCTSLVFLSCEKVSDSTTKTPVQTVDTVEVAKADEPEELSSQTLFDLFLKKKYEVQEKLRTTSKEEADHLYETYFEENKVILNDIIESEMDVLIKYYSEENDRKKLVENLRKKLEKLGLKYEELGEGEVEITTNSDFYVSIFGNYVSDDYEEYIFNLGEESKIRYSADAGLLITFKELGERIVKWEDFLKKYPKSKLAEEVKEAIKNYQRDYIMGADNTPTVNNSNSDSIYIYERNKIEFERFIKNHPKSPTVDLINWYLENFKRERIQDLIVKEQEK